jgi:hypothetical protein
MSNLQNYISSLLKENNFTSSEIDKIKLSQNENNEVYYKAIDYSSKFIKEVFLPFLEHPINPSEKERVVNHIFLKIYALILSILKLNDLRNFQAIASITRSIFELYLELNK